MNIHTFRLKPKMYLRQSIQNYARENKFKAGAVLTIVGGLQKLSLRMAGATPNHQEIKEINQEVEIVSAVGTLEEGDCHIHISVSDKTGTVVGGHLKEGIVAFTAEVALLELEDRKFSREFDKTTGFDELVIK